MNKRTIIELVVAFSLLQGLYHILMFMHPEISEQTNTSGLSFIILLSLLVFISWALWKDTTPDFLTFMDGKKMHNLMSYSMLLVWITMNFKFFNDFYGTAVYEQKQFLINGMILLFISSIVIWFKVVYTRIIFLYVKMQNL